MTDEELITRLRERAAEERVIQKNNEAVAAALMGQRLPFDQGVHSASNSFAARLGLEHENCAKNDAKLARDWDAAADRIEALVKERDEATNQLDSARHSVDVLEKRVEAALREAANVAARFGPGRPLVPLVERNPNARIVGRWEDEQAASAAISAAILALLNDAATFGIGIMQDTKRIAPQDFFAVRDMDGKP